MSRVPLGSPLMAFARLSLYVGLTLPLMLVQLIANQAKLPLRKTLPLWYHRQCCRILGIHVERRGRQSRKRPTLYVSNHISYLDITILGALIPGSFVAKAEVRSWPYFGWLAKLQRTVFVERRASRSGSTRDEITGRLAEGDNLILFPEGTSGDGNRVLPFKSALLSVAEHWGGGEPLAVQPVSVAYTKLDGLPLGRHLRPFYAWYGDMDLLPHLWQLAGLGQLTVVVHFHPVVTLEQLGSRKVLSNHCHEQTGRGLAAALAGRPLRQPRDPEPV
ncbi:MAG: 1-acyl-sn-glycerol-3-phosphate acyltransferase [Rhodospirillales bacterium]|nr:1-acyl-sn-glycerol-3-phosphate acyltransferase [Rhodospirillales bacterium]